MNDDSGEITVSYQVEKGRTPPGVDAPVRFTFQLEAAQHGTSVLRFIVPELQARAIRDAIDQVLSSLTIARAVPVPARNGHGGDG